MAVYKSLYSCSKEDVPTANNTINVVIPGTLDSLLTVIKDSTITELTITGTIDVRDIKYMRDSMPELAYLDLKDAEIAAYTENVGTIGSISYIYPANTLPDNSFFIYPTDNGTLKNIVLPFSLTSIGVCAFDGRTGLTTIIIPESVTSIANGAFADCSGLTSFTIPGNVISIENSVFRNCTGLTSLTIPGTTTIIRGSAFQGCTGLKSIIIPEGVTSLGPSAFQDCTGLSSIIIPASVTSIWNNIFSGCTSLTSISVNASGKYLSSVAGVLFSKDKSVLLCYPEGIQGDYTIPESVTSIGHSAFSGCTNLKSITIPNSVTSISFSAFQDCTGLTTFTIPSGVTVFQSTALAGCTNISSLYAYPIKPVNLVYSSFDGINLATCILHVPAGSKSAYQTAKYWKDFKNIVEMTM